MGTNLTPQAGTVNTVLVCCLGEKSFITENVMELNFLWCVGTLSLLYIVAVLLVDTGCSVDE